MAIHYWIYQVLKQSSLIGSRRWQRKCLWWWWWKQRILQATHSKETPGLPVILINGGPGYPHNYMLPMKVPPSWKWRFQIESLFWKVLACQGHQVIFYDQVIQDSCLRVANLWFIPSYNIVKICRQAQDYPQYAHPPTQQPIPMTVTYLITPGKGYKHAMFVS